MIFQIRTPEFKYLFSSNKAYNIKIAKEGLGNLISDYIESKGLK
jgi:hypothetical protein